MFSLQRLLSPKSEKEFLTSFWERTPLLIQRTSNRYYGELFDVSVFNTLVKSSFLCPPQIEMFKSGSAQPDRDFMLGGAVNPIATRHLLDSGASVVINGAHKYHNPLALFCRSIEKSFSHPVQANAYFTPPHSQAFKTHFDDHDVFVLQVSGSKHWRLYDRPIINPMPGQAFDPVKDPGRQVVDGGGPLQR